MNEKNENVSMEFDNIGYHLEKLYQQAKHQSTNYYSLNFQCTILWDNHKSRKKIALADLQLQALYKNFKNSSPLESSGETEINQKHRYIIWIIYYENINPIFV